MSTRLDINNLSLKEIRSRIFSNGKLESVPLDITDKLARSVEITTADGLIKVAEVSGTSVLKTADELIKMAEVGASGFKNTCLVGDGEWHPFALDEVGVLMDELMALFIQLDFRAINWYGLLLNTANAIMSSGSGHDQIARKEFKKRVARDLELLKELSDGHPNESFQELVRRLLSLSDTHLGTKLLPPPSGTT